MTVRESAHRLRYVLLALVVSAVVHAAAILGVPRALDAAALEEPPSYTAELISVPPASGAAASKSQAAPPRAPRPRSSRKPTEAIASLPPLPSFASDGTASLPELLPPPPDLAPQEPPSRKSSPRSRPPRPSPTRRPHPSR